MTPTWGEKKKKKKKRKKTLQPKRLLRILKSQRPVSPLPSSTVVNKPENEKNSDITVYRTQLTTSALSKGIQIKNGLADHFFEVDNLQIGA